MGAVSRSTRRDYLEPGVRWFDVQDRVAKLYDRADAGIA